MRIRSSVVVATAAALALAGCGSSGSSSKPASGSNSVSDPGSAVVRAADVTGASSGYRFHATMSITGTATPVRATIGGTILRSPDRGEIALHEQLAGRSLRISERFRGKTYWVSATGIPDASALTSKAWLKYNVGSTLSALGVGGLPNDSSDPTQFLTYLKAVGGGAHRLGTATIRGVQTTHYAVTVDLNHYVRLVKPGQRAAARETVKRLISTIGSSTIQMQVWIDGHDLARRLYLSFPECVAQQHLRLGMTIDLFDFGTKANVTLPVASQSYDITPLVNQQLSGTKLGCAASD